jgi:hypothetical protein
MKIDRLTRFTLCAIACMCLMAGVSRAADELVDNPAYKSWSKHKVGSTVELQSSTDAGGQTFKTAMTQKLVELTPEKAVVEMSIKIDIPGATAPPAQKQSFAAKVKKEDATVGKLPQGMKGEVKDKGSEKVSVAGKSYNCKVYEFTGEQNGVKSTGKTWTSEEIPGTLVKMESTTNVGGQDMKTSMAVSKVETK